MTDPHTSTPPHPRAIRSYVRREGRLTPAQATALGELWPRFGLDAPVGAFDLDALYGCQARRTLELGFGNGEHLLARAVAAPGEAFLGVEVHRPGVGHLLHEMARLDVANVRVACHDGVEVLERWLAPATLDELVLYFPDPWPKKRHHKRRLVQPAFAALASSRLKPGGLWRLATDREDYALQMKEVLDATPALENTAADGGFVPRPADRPPTRFERRGERLGHGVWDLCYRRVAAADSMPAASPTSVTVPEHGLPPSRQ